MSYRSFCLSVLTASLCPLLVNGKATADSIDDSALRALSPYGQMQQYQATLEKLPLRSIVSAYERAQTDSSERIAAVQALNKKLPTLSNEAIFEVTDKLNPATNSYTLIHCYMNGERHQNIYGRIPAPRLILYIHEHPEGSSRFLLLEGELSRRLPSMTTDEILATINQLPPSSVVRWPCLAEIERRRTIRRTTPNESTIENNLVKSKSAQSSDADDLALYYRDMARRLKRAWFPLRASAAYKVVVGFQISESGQTSDVKILESSGIKEADGTAIVAIRNASPFRPIAKPIDVHFYFDYKSGQLDVGTSPR